MLTLLLWKAIDTGTEEKFDKNNKNWKIFPGSLSARNQPNRFHFLKMNWNP